MWGIGGGGRLPDYGPSQTLTLIYTRLEENLGHNWGKTQILSAKCEVKAIMLDLFFLPFKHSQVGHRACCQEMEVEVGEWLACRKMTGALPKNRIRAHFGQAAAPGCFFPGFNRGVNYPLSLSASHSDLCIWHVMWKEGEKESGGVILSVFSVIVNICILSLPLGSIITSPSLPRTLFR